MGERGNEELPSEVARTWRRVANNVDFHLVPGDHQSCIIQHVSVVGEIIAERLRAARSSPTYRESGPLRAPIVEIDGG
jgi:hypothetical protein